MTKFLLMRHGQPDFSGPDKWNAPGWGGDLAPLTELGEQQVSQQLARIREFNPEMVIVSPMTRAVHSALIIRSAIPAQFKVEFDLHEWVRDAAFQWQGIEDALKLQLDFDQCHGEWPPGETRPWETLSHIRERMLAVLRRYDDHDRVLVVCHGQLIKAVTGVSEVDFASLVPFELDS